MSRRLSRPRTHWTAGRLANILLRKMREMMRTIFGPRFDTLIRKSARAIPASPIVDLPNHDSPAPTFCDTEREGVMD